MHLHSSEGSRSSVGGVWQGRYRAQAIILVGAYNTSQQVNAVRVFIFRGNISLPQCLVVIIVTVVAIQDIVIIIVVIIFVIVIMVLVNIFVARTGTRRTQSTRGSGCRTTTS
jgi:hypothetical protein